MVEDGSEGSTGNFSSLQNFIQQKPLDTFLPATPRAWTCAGALPLVCALMNQLNSSMCVFVCVFASWADRPVRTKCAKESTQLGGTQVPKNNARGPVLMGGGSSTKRSQKEERSRVGKRSGRTPTLGPEGRGITLFLYRSALVVPLRA